MPLWCRQVHCYECTNDCSAMHRNGEVLNNCKCLWIQVGAELAAVQLLYLGSIRERVNQTATRQGALRQVCADSANHLGITSLQEPNRPPLARAGSRMKLQSGIVRNGASIP